MQVTPGSASGRDPDDEADSEGEASEEELVPHSPTREELGDDFWDPPCRVCKVVDDEPNVLCELCNGAYHLACIANMKPALPRSPDDDEWFCRGCIKRGVPEAIIDRVGRGSSAHYLVKWLGSQAWEVSWHDAIALDTAWCRKLIAAHYAAREARLHETPLLPPCHKLIDVRVAGDGTDGADAGNAGPREAGAAELSEHASLLCVDADATAHLAPVLAAAGALAALHRRAHALGSGAASASALAKDDEVTRGRCCCGAGVGAVRDRVAEVTRGRPCRHRRARPTR